MREARDEQNRPWAAGRHVLSDGDFAAHYERYYRLLWVIAAGIATPAAADDLVHQAAVQALSKREQFRPGTDFAAWMSQIVRYVAQNHVRAAKRHHTTPLGGDMPDKYQAEPVPARPLELTDQGQLPEDQQDFDDEVMAALNELSETARACLLLRTIQNLSYRQIAWMLDIPEGTAMSHVHRSRKQLRDRLQNRLGYAQTTQGIAPE